VWRNRKIPQIQYIPQLSERASVLGRDRSLVGVTNTEAFSACIFASQNFSFTKKIQQDATVYQNFISYLYEA
jgi:hypothetical protein